MAWNEKPFLKLYYYENDSFHLDAIIDDYKDCSFSRNLFEAGEFTITINMNIPNAKKFKMGMFVQFGNDPYDVGEIKSVSDSLTETGKGDQVLTITGYDARIIFQKRIIKNMNANGKWEMTGAGELIIRSLVRDQCGEFAEAKRRLPVVNEFPADFNFKGDTYSISETYGNLYDVLCTIATNSKLGWRMKMTSSGFTLETYEGNDLSKTVKFSPEYDSLANGSFSESSENFTNAVYVGGKGDDDDRDIYEGEAGSPTGLDRVECWDDKSDLTTTEEYANEALSILNSFSQTLSVSAQGLAKNPYEYKKQYDVGDYITISFNDKTAVCQIISISENWSKGAYGIDFEFGKPLSTLGGQLNAMLQMIHRASDKGSSTDSVRWYTIPTDTEMPSCDVTYRTIGFIGDVGSNATFKLYLDDQRNGAKTYHVYFKQLGGTGKLTLTTGVSGAVDLVMNPGTYVAIITVKENGDIQMASSTPTNTVQSGNNQPVTSDAVSETVSYSSNETLTGGTWIDGKPIYRIIFPFNRMLIAGDTIYTVNVGQANFDTLIKAYYMGRRPNMKDVMSAYFPTWTAEEYTALKIYASSDEIMFVDYMVLEYTKKTTT